MSNLDILYKLQDDSDSYWTLYDLCLENGWADPGIQLIIPWYIPKDHDYYRSFISNEIRSHSQQKSLSLAMNTERSVTRMPLP
jgi:hypothetical protein